MTTKLCVVDCLKEYLKRCNAKVQADTKTLFITQRKPFGAAAIDSMRRWVKQIYIEKSLLKEYIPHTTNSTASQLNVDLAEIVKQGSWKNAKKLFNFYKKDIIYYAPEDVDLQNKSVLTWSIYVHMQFIFIFMLANQNIFNTIYNQRFKYSLSFTVMI